MPAKEEEGAVFTIHKYVWGGRRRIRTVNTDT